jgi:hypothetical protein
VLVSWQMTNAVVRNLSRSGPCGGVGARKCLMRVTNTPVAAGVVPQHGDPAWESFVRFQPKPLQSAAAIPAQRHRAVQSDLDRLVATWRSIAASMVSAEAHHRDDSVLMHQLGLVEEAIQLRYPRDWRHLEPALLTAVLDWSHDGSPGAERLCMWCRKIAVGLPIELPLPAEGRIR